MGDAARPGLSRERLLCAVLAGGYLFLLGDTWIEHQVVIESRPQAWIPRLSAAASCLVLLLTAVGWTTALRRVAVGFLAASVIVGLLGFWFHNAARFADGFDLRQVMWPPLLAPLAFTGQGLLGMVAIWPGERWRSPRSSAR